MYGGVGLKTARGSSTNGHVQRSLAHVTEVKALNHRQRNTNTLSSTYSHSHSRLAVNSSTSSEEILAHERARLVELAVAEWAQAMDLLDKAESGDLEAESQINERRILLLKEAEQKALQSHDNLTARKRPEDRSYNRRRNDVYVPKVRDAGEYETHARRLAKEAETDRFARALRIDREAYVPGSAFDRELQEQKRAEALERRAEALLDAEEQERRLELERQQQQQRSLDVDPMKLSSTVDEESRATVIAAGEQSPTLVTVAEPASEPSAIFATTVELPSDAKHAQHKERRMPMSKRSGHRSALPSPPPFPSSSSASSWSESSGSEDESPFSARASLASSFSSSSSDESRDGRRRHRSRSRGRRSPAFHEHGRSPSPRTRSRSIERNRHGRYRRSISRSPFSSESSELSDHERMQRGSRRSSHRTSSRSSRSWRSRDSRSRSKSRSRHRSRSASPSRSQRRIRGRDHRRTPSPVRGSSRDHYHEWNRREHSSGRRTEKTDGHPRAKSPPSSGTVRSLSSTVLQSPHLKPTTNHDKLQSEPAAGCGHRCAQCGGWGLGLIASDQTHCTHCLRQLLLRKR